MRIEDRDRKVLSEVFLSRVIRRDDLVSLGYFGSVSRCNARLLGLRREGFLAVRTRLEDTMLQGPLYICRSKGVRVAAEDSDLPVDQALETHRSGIRELAIRHALRCTDLRIRILREIERLRGPRLLQWSHELLCRHEFQPVLGRAVLIKPDGLCVIRTGNEDRHLFLEVDLGNVSLPRFREKLTRYCLYADSGAFADVYPAVDFAVLIVTTDERRLQNLAGLSHRPEFAFTTWQRLQRHQFVETLLTSWGNLPKGGLV